MVDEKTEAGSGIYTDGTEAVWTYCLVRWLWERPPIQAALFLDDAAIARECVVSINLAGKSQPATRDNFQRTGLGLTPRWFHQAKTFRRLIDTVLRAVHELIPENTSREIVANIAKYTIRCALKFQILALSDPCRAGLGASAS
jgi:hypothetical protein